MRHALQGLQDLTAPAVLERLTLLANHLLASEPVATMRLAPHRGKAIALHVINLPALLPPAPPMSWRITPAGLLELETALATTELTLTVDAGQPLQLLAQAVGAAPPQAEIAGDAALAADVAWLLKNLRWDAAADLERLLPPAVAHGVVQAGGALVGMLRTALARFVRVTPPAG